MKAPYLLVLSLASASAYNELDDFRKLEFQDVIVTDRRTEATEDTLRTYKQGGRGVIIGWIIEAVITAVISKIADIIVDELWDSSIHAVAKEDYSGGSPRYIVTVTTRNFLCHIDVSVYWGFATYIRWTTLECMKKFDPQITTYRLRNGEWMVWSKDNPEWQKAELARKPLDFKQQLDEIIIRLKKQI